MLRIGSLFSGAGWLDLAIEEVFGGETVWVSDIDPGACKVLAYRFPHARNLGDITKVDWCGVPEVALVGGGSPCQDISSAGGMTGMVEGTRSNLWVEMREAIRILRPMFVVWENVQAARSTKAASRFWPDHIDRCIAHHLAVAKETRHAPTEARHRRAAHRLMEQRARRVGVAYPKPPLRALGRVLGDLADLWFDAEWVSLPASGVGAPHLRRRFFVLGVSAEGWAWLAANATHFGHQRGGKHGTGGPDLRTVVGALADTDIQSGGERRLTEPGEATGGRALGELAGRDRAPVDARPWWVRDVLNRVHAERDAGVLDEMRLLPTPMANEAEKAWLGPRQSPGQQYLSHVVGAILPTPSAGNFNDGEDPEQWEERRQRVKETSGNGNGMGMPLGIAVQLLPTPRRADADATMGAPGAARHVAAGNGSLAEVIGVDLLPTPTAADGERSSMSYGRGNSTLTGAVQNWGPYAPAIERWSRIVGPAPAPTKPGRKGRLKPNPEFASWLMGAAPGWVTDVPGVTDNEALRIAGNGVVRQQAVVALRLLVSRFVADLEVAA